VTTTTRNVRSRPTQRDGQTIAPVRLPVNGIQVPISARVHGTMAILRQQPTRRAPRRTSSLARAASGWPAGLLTVIVYRHGTSTTGLVELITIVALTGLAADVVAAPTNAAAHARRSSRRIAGILGPPRRDTIASE